MDDVPNNLRDQEWRVDKGTNQVAYERMSKALTTIASDMYNGPRWLRNLITLHHKTWEGGAAANSHSDSPVEHKPSHMIFDEDKDVNANVGSDHCQMVAGDSSLSHLNQTQKDAVVNSLQHQISLIQGPPGTVRIHAFCNCLV